jgi:HSP20 family protein
MAMSPFRRGRGFYDLHSEMNRLFDETYGGLSRQPERHQRAQHLTEWAPTVDVLTRDDDLVIRAELPGVRPEDVDITVQDRVLTISGERGEEQEEQRAGYYVRERRRGSFRRSMTLPEGVDEDRVRARYENGVLEVTIEGAAAVREPRRIRVEADESPGIIEGPSGARTQETPPSRAESRAGTSGQATPAGATPEPRDVSPRTEEEREGARRQPEREREEEDKGLLDRAREAILGEEEEPRRRTERTDRPEDRR